MDGFPTVGFVAVVFVLAGGGFVAATIRSTWDDRALRRRALRCAGTVIGERSVYHPGQGHNDHGHYTHHAMVSFQAADGKQWQVVSTDSQKKGSRPHGEQVEVLYDPLDPTRAYTGGPPGSVFGTVFRVCFGMMFLVIGVVTLYHQPFVRELLPW